MVFEKLEEKKIRKEFITLHVGAGTFKPVNTDTLNEHEMHAEFFMVSIKTIGALLEKSGENIVAVGTTSLRTIESLYWLGVKLAGNNAKKELSLSQWEVYKMEQDLDARTALNNILQWMDQNKQETLFTRTQIIIAPGYRPRVANALITNFHQPRSTLLLLIAALIGDDWKKVYDYALKNEFRFLSYGDGCLLWIPEAENR